MNPVLNGLPNLGQNFGQFKQMFQMFKFARNPQAILNQMIANNPNSKQIMDYVNQFNGDYKSAFETKAREMGVDINDFLNSMK